MCRSLELAPLGSDYDLTSAFNRKTESAAARIVNTDRASSSLSPYATILE